MEIDIDSDVELVRPEDLPDDQDDIRMQIIIRNIEYTEKQLNMKDNPIILFDSSKVIYPEKFIDKISLTISELKVKNNNAATIGASLFDFQHSWNIPTIIKDCEFINNKDIVFAKFSPIHDEPQ